MVWRKTNHISSLCIFYIACTAEKEPKELFVALLMKTQLISGFGQDQYITGSTEVCTCTVQPWWPKECFCLYSSTSFCLHLCQTPAGRRLFPNDQHWPSWFNGNQALDAISLKFTGLYTPLGRELSFHHLKGCCFCLWSLKVNHPRYCSIALNLD